MFFTSKLVFNDKNSTEKVHETSNKFVFIYMS